MRFFKNLSNDISRIQSSISLRNDLSSSWLGSLIGTVDSYVPNYSKLISPIMDLLSGGKPVAVGEEHERAYYKLKEEFFKDFPLMQPKLNEPFYLVLHISEDALAGCMSRGCRTG